jgi:hypothetical protein
MMKIAEVSEQLGLSVDTLRYLRLPGSPEIESAMSQITVMGDRY